MKSTLRLLQDRAPVSYVGHAMRVPFFTPNTTQTQQQAYGSVGTLFSIVHTLSDSTSQVGWGLWRKSVDGRRRYAGEETRTPVTRHAALDLWNRPNPWYTRKDLVESTQQHGDLTGEAWWVIAYAPGLDLPIELWPVRPDRMAPVPDPDQFISGYVYSGPNGEQVPLALNEVIQPIKLPNPQDPYRGLGPVQALLTDLDSMRYSAEWNRQFFLNSAEPGGIIEFPEAMNDREWKKMVTRWREQHQGIAGAHRVAILERGKWVDRNMSQRDMQFAELRKVSREIVREAFGMHGHILGLSEDVNKANAEAADASFGKRKVRPRLERIKQALNTKLLPLYGPTAEGLEFDYENPEPPDRESDNAELAAKTAAFKTLIDAGVDEDDAADICGLPHVTISRDRMPSAPAPAG